MDRFERLHPGKAVNPAGMNRATEICHWNPHNFHLFLMWFLCFSSPHGYRSNGTSPKCDRWIQNMASFAVPDFPNRTPEFPNLRCLVGCWHSLCSHHVTPCYFPSIFPGSLGEEEWQEAIHLLQQLQDWVLVGFCLPFTWGVQKKSFELSAYQSFLTSQEVKCFFWGIARRGKWRRISSVSMQQSVLVKKQGIGKATRWYPMHSRNFT